MKRLACLLLIAALLLTGCTASVPIREGEGPTLPPAKAVYQAPSGDDARDLVESVLLYLPDARSGLARARAVTMALLPNRHPAESVLQRLLSFSGDADSAPLFAGAELALFPASSVEVSGNTATVNLAPSALSLTGEDLLLAARCITNTLCQWGDIRYVNLLIAGKHPGIDISGLLPMGSMAHTDNEERLWGAESRQERFSAVATLYYPAALGRGVLAEARAVTFPGKDLPSMALGLLTALSAQAQALPGTPDVPPLDMLLAEPISVAASASGSGRVISLAFDPAANETFISHGIPRSVMMASLVMTLTTFLPGIEGVSVRIGEEAVQSLAPTGLSQGSGETIQFKDGVMRRSDFSRFLLALMPVCLLGADGTLTLSQRALPYYRTHNIRALFEQLCAGPDAAETAAGLRSVLPGGITGADLIGFTAEKDTVLLNLSRHFLDACQGMTPAEERQAVYAMVNTVCALRGMRRVRFFIAGEQPDTFAGSLYLPGEFLEMPL